MNRRSSKAKNAFTKGASPLKALDMFAADLPTFNVSGQSKIQTYLGGLLSAMIIIVTLLFASVKMHQLVEHDNPSINSNIEKDYYSINDTYQLSN